MDSTNRALVILLGMFLAFTLAMFAVDRLASTRPDCASPDSKPRAHAMT